MTSYSQGPGHSHGIATGHMKEMLRRIWDLEQRVNEQTELMNRRDSEHAARFKNMERQKDLEMAALQQDIVKMKERCRQLEGFLRERDVQIAYMFHRCSYLDEAASYVPLLDQLSQCLKSSLASPPPKIQPVKPTRTSTTSGHDYTPDVPAAPSEKPNPASPSNAALALADHFVRTPKPQQHQQQQQQQQRPQPYPQHYPENGASVFAPNPNVALNAHSGKK